MPSDSLTPILVGAALSLIGVLVGALITNFFTSRRERQAETRARQEKLKEASSAIVEILSEWVRSSYTRRLTNEDRWRLQTVYWRAMLTLDKRLVDLLIPALAHLPGAPPTNQIIVNARRVLLDLPEPDIRAEDLNNWLPHPRRGRKAPARG